MEQNKDKENLIAKLVESKAKPKFVIKANKKTGEKEKYYYESFSWSGKRTQITSKSLSDFVSKIDDILYQLTSEDFAKEGKMPLPLKDAFNIYLQEVRLAKLDDYCEERKRGNYMNSHGIVRLIEKFLHQNGIVYFHEIDENILQKFRYHCLYLSKKPNKEITVYKKISTISCLNRYLINYTSYRPSECNFKKFQTNKKRELTNFLSEKEIENLLKASPIHLQRLIQFFLYTGMRKQNGFDLKWNEVDFVNRQITVQVKQNKTHTVPIVRQLFDLLVEVKNEQISLYGKLHEYVFLYEGNRLKDAKRSMNTALKKANITLPKGQLFHVLRHTCAVTLINKGIDLYTVQKILGHSSPAMTQKYARLETKTIASKMEMAFSEEEK